MKLKMLALGIFLSVPTLAHAQSSCSGQPASGFVCGNAAASTALPGFYSQSALLDRGFGSGVGTLLNRGLSGWVATVAPSLGVNGGTGGSLVFNGSTSGSATISVPAAAGSVLFQLPSTNGSNNGVLSTDGAGHLSWVNLTGTGTVTSVALAMPGIFAVSGSPVTVSGTLTAALNTQSANTVWAGPSSGGASAPTFRALVGADLPAPTTGSLGGVQANNAVSHQWINAVSTSGVPQLSQPSFTDISGTAAASQLPTPTTSTLGGVEATNVVASNWIRSINTSGVPQFSQPSFGDISGTASLGQLPSIGNNTILANISGGSASPLATSQSMLLDTIGATQGDILYRGASGWLALGPGTSGQVLSTGGAAANPTWTTVTGTGTVTSVGSGTGLTGGPITSSGSLSLASIANGTVLANVSGGSAAPSATAPSAVLDIVGSTEGSLLYRGASNWSPLTPGSNGQFLQTTGPSSTPQWATAVSSAAVVAGNGISTSGTCTITTTGSCTITNSGLSAKVHMASSQSVTSGVTTKVAFDSVDFDSTNAWNTTNKNFSPSIAGTYELCAAITPVGTFSAGTTGLNMFFSKNGLSGGSGTTLSQSFNLSAGAASSSSIHSCVLVPMNGTSDTVEIDVNLGGTSPAVQGAPSITSFATFHRVGS